MKKFIFILAAFLAALSAPKIANAALSVSNVTAVQRAPHNGLVDVEFTLKQTDATATDYDVFVALSARDAAQPATGNGAEVKVLRVLSFAEGTAPGTGFPVTGSSVGTLGPLKATAAGKRWRVVWNMGFDNPQLKTSRLVVNAQAYTAKKLPDYDYICIRLDINGDINGNFTPADKYPVWTSIYAPNPDSAATTSELWVRRIRAGTYTMGSPADEKISSSNSTVHNSDETQHTVVISRDYYIGVFEVTREQWERVMGKGTIPSGAGGSATHPVTRVSFENIRGTMSGSSFPLNNEVDNGSFIGKLRARSGLAFDLPTEAQWEYACRGGATNHFATAFNNGILEDGYTVKGQARWNTDIDNGHCPVKASGSNSLGLYGMHGNAAEWCLDIYDENYGLGSGVATTTTTDPKGPTTSAVSSRVVRGGYWHEAASACRSASRSSAVPSSGLYWYSYIAGTDPVGAYGLRLCLPSFITQTTFQATPQQFRP